MSPFTLTDQQEKAIYTHDHNFIMTAGAGSGKTFVLVERYLALLDVNPDWQINNLVAITFTKKAAQEMRDRVRRGLEERDSERLAQVDSARIDTIHGLCASLIRANAAHAGVDPDFVVLDETEAAILRDDAIESVLAQVVADDDPVVALFAEYNTRSLREILSNFALINTDIDTLPDDLLAHWQALWWRSIVERAGDLLSFADGLNLDTYDPPPDDKFALQFEMMCDDLERMRDGDPEPCLDVLQKIAGLKSPRSSADAWGGKEILEAVKADFDAVRKTAKKHLEKIGALPGSEGTFDTQAAAFVPLWVQLIGYVRIAYQSAKQRNSQLDFDDLEEITADLLSRSEDVRRRYQGAEFRHVLVDEFQDTNARQWEIIKGLANLHTPGSMFVVGDEKQSIYAFRGADVSVFGEVKSEITGAAGELLPLSKSFRTHSPLIACFNHIFGNLLRKHDASPVRDYQVERGEAMTASRREMPDAPLIDFIFTNRESCGRGAVDIETARTWEAYEIARYLNDNVGQRMVYDKRSGETRPMRYDDVAILFRALTEVNLYESVFKAQGIPFVTVAGRGYYNRQEVWDLLNLLRALYNPVDDLSLASALRSPLFGLSDDALYALRLSGESTLWQALEQPGDLLPADEVRTVAFACNVLYALREMSGRVTISELLREALAQTGYLAVLSGLPDGARRRGNVEKLLEKAQSSGKITLSAFSRYLSDLSAREVREGEALLDVEGAVTLMSVHASKGLEYPVIVLADATRDNRGGSDKPVQFDRTVGLACKVNDPDAGKLTSPFAIEYIKFLDGLREDAESLRLLYVAATRAQDALVVSGHICPYSNGGWKVAGWMGHLLASLGLLNSIEDHFDNTVSFTFEDGHEGTVHLTLHDSVPDKETFTAGQSVDDTGLWEDETVKQRRPFDEVEPVAPTLLDEIVIRREAQAKHIAATHIADLGGVDYGNADQREYYRNRFRRRVLQDAPSVIDRVSNREKHVRQAQVGEIVHEALRWWRFPKSANDDDYKQMLRAYAWRQGITDDQQCEEAVDRAYALINRFVNDELFTWVDAADETYRELPFIYQRENRIIHGIIDTLLRHDDTWTVIDYKTSYVSGGNLDEHARRYHLQVGVYAEAVSAQIGEIVPRTFIHYIRYNRAVEITEDAWRGALSRSLTDRIQKIVDEE